MTMPKLRRRIVIGLLGGFIIFAGVSWYVGGALVAPANHVVGPPPAGLSIVEAEFTSRSGSPLAAWLMEAKDSSATIILLHGIRGDRTFLVERAKLLHAAGYSIVMIDLQAHGESAGKHITVGYLERLDVQGAVDYVRKTHPTHRIGISGRSLGGAAAVLASPMEVDAMVLESVYPTISEAVHNRVATRLGALSYVLTPALLCQLQPRLGISPADLRPIDKIAAVGCPVLIAAGDADQETTLAETERMFAAAQDPKELVFFEGAGHIDLLAHDRQKYQSNIVSFFDKYLKDVPSADKPLKAGD